MASKHIVVVGAGISGLTAAFKLHRAGHHVQVFESSQDVGGRMITREWQGIRFDPGAEFLTGADKYLLEMVDELDVREHLVDYSQEQTGFELGVMRGGQVHKMNFMSMGSILSWKGVSLGARLSLVKLLPHLMRYSKSDPYHPELAPGDDDQTMEEFFYQKINIEMFEYWVEPMMDVFCGYTADALSAKMMLLLFGNYLGTKLYTFKEGIGFLPETLADRMEILRSAVVTKIQVKPDGSGVSLHYLHQGLPQTLDADLVVIAMPGDGVMPLFEEPRPAWKAFFPLVEYSRVGIVYSILEGDDPVLDEGGIMFPRKEPWKLSALGWKRQPDGRIWSMSDLKSYLYDPSLDDETLRHLVTEEVLQAMPAFEGRIRDQMVFRWPRKVPNCRPGYLTALKAFKENPQEEPIYFCGDYLIAGSAGSALASGWQAAERVLQRIS